MSYKLSEAMAIARDAFSSVAGPGALERGVRTAYASAPDIKVDVEWLKKKYVGLGCSHVVKLIDYLNSDDGKKLLEISCSINPVAETSDEFSLESLQSLCIGSLRRNITPMQWLAYAAYILSNTDVPPEQIKALDLVCSDLSLTSAKEVAGGDVF